MGEDVGRKLHQLEALMQMDASEILDVIAANNRLQIALKGAVAQEYLRRHLIAMVASGDLDEVESVDRDGQPDFRITYRGRVLLLECKNVEKQKRSGGPITIDFQRTRAPKDAPQLRYYHEQEFAVLAACLFNRTASWEFRFIRTSVLTRLVEFPDRFSNRVVVEGVVPYLEHWSGDLLGVLRTMD